MPIKNLLKASLAGAALLALSFTGASAAPSIPCGTAKLIFLGEQVAEQM